MLRTPKPIIRPSMPTSRRSRGSRQGGLLLLGHSTFGIRQLRLISSAREERVKQRLVSNLRSAPR